MFGSAKVILTFNPLSNECLFFTLECYNQGDQMGHIDEKNSYKTIPNILLLIGYFGKVAT